MALNTRQIKRGDTWSEYLTYATADDEPIDLSEIDLRLQLRDRSSDELAIDASIENGKIILDDQVVGGAFLRIDAEEMKLLEPGTYACDIELTFEDGTVRSTPTFFVAIVKDITYET
jgi:hypothetical protein